MQSLGRHCSCIKVAERPKFTPCTKHIALKYHNFCQFFNGGTIKINPIDTKEQMANILQSHCMRSNSFISDGNYADGDLNSHFSLQGSVRIVAYSAMLDSSHSSSMEFAVHYLKLCSSSF